MPPPLTRLTDKAIRALRMLSSSNNQSAAADLAGVTRQYMSLLVKDPRSQPYLKEMGISGYEKRNLIVNPPSPYANVYPPSPYADTPLKKFKFKNRDHDEEFLLTDTERKLLEAYHQINSPRKAARLAGVPVATGASRISKLTRNPKGQRYIAYLQGEPYDHIEIPITVSTPTPGGLTVRKKEALETMLTSRSLSDAALRMGVARSYMSSVRNSPEGQAFLKDNPLPYVVLPGGGPARNPLRKGTPLASKKTKLPVHVSPLMNLDPRVAEDQRFWREEQAIPTLRDVDPKKAHLTAATFPSEEVPNKIEQEELFDILGSHFDYRKRY